MAASTPLQGLRVRKLADRTAPRFDAVTGEPLNEPLPFAGLQIEGDAPSRTMLPTSFVDRGTEEGWITLEGEQVVHRPGGPPGNLWAVTHTFRHADAIVLNTVDGDVRYRVTHQPDKYVDTRDPVKHKDGLAFPSGPGPEDKKPVTDELYADGDTRVDWFYIAELES